MGNILQIANQQKPFLRCGMGTPIMLYHNMEKCMFIRLTVLRIGTSGIPHSCIRIGRLIASIYIFKLFHCKTVISYVCNGIILTTSEGFLKQINQYLLISTR